jgi:hypothetical protein
MIKRYSFSTLSIAVFLMAAIGSCTSQAANNSYASEGKHGKHKKETPIPEESAPVATTSNSSGAPSGDCDQSLWNHVYNPTRLTVLKQCMTVTGTVQESNVDDDGDQHFLVKLDPGQDQLLTKKNLKKKNGDLVGEIVCANKAKLKKAKDACAGWSNPVPLPTVGSHVSVIGTFVLDTHNGWNEIHPVSSVK